MSGCEWVVEAYGCDPVSLADLARLKTLWSAMVEELSLHPVSDALWHQFPGTGGVTGLSLLSESHFACHTFPEHQSLCLNLFCCRARPQWDFVSYLQREFAASRVSVRHIERPFTLP